MNLNELQSLNIRELNELAQKLSIQGGVSGLNKQELIVKILQFTIWSLDKIDDWTKDSIFETLKIVADLTNLKLKRFLAPIFVSIAGTTSSISVMDSICILGKISSVERINKSIELLGGVTEQKYNEFLLEFNQSDS